MPNPNRIPLADAAFRRGISYQQVRTMLFKGELKGGKDEFGRFFVDRAALERRARNVPSPRAQGKRRTS